MPQRESAFQADLIRELRAMFPGCIILKNDANYLQGFPDLLILHGRYWAALEVKADARSSHQPNQDYYVGLCDDMSYSCFVYPQNKEAVLNDLQRALRTGRAPRISER